jgi:molybdate transport system ATP-binding protein
MGLSLKLLKKVEGFTLDVEWKIGNELAILFGSSGSGKSMTLQLIAGLTDPDAGLIRSNGFLLYDSSAGINVSPQKRCLGYVFQDRVLFPHMTVKKNVAYGLRESDRPEMADRLREMLRLFHLEGLENRFPSEISGGEKQRVALARALIGRPKALLLDEPFSGLDRPIRLELSRLLTEIRNEFDLPVLFVTHDIFEDYALPDKIIVYSGGRIIQVGSPNEVFDHPCDAEVERLTRFHHGMSPSRQ